MSYLLLILTNLFFCVSIYSMLTKEDLSHIQKLFQKQFREGIMSFWEEVLEPVMATKSDLENLATKAELNEVKEELTEVHHKVDSIDRKFNSEISYRDRLERRVVKIETKVGINK